MTGAAIRTTLVTRSALTPLDPAAASPWIAFFFGLTDEPLDANPFASGLAEVVSGWSGVVEISTATGLASVTPEPRTSAAEVMATLERLASRRCGGAWSWWPTMDGRIVVRGSVPFDLVATGNTRARLGLTGGYTGASLYVAHDPHVGAIYPSGGLLLDGADGVTWSSDLGATGSRVSAGRRTDQQGRLRLFGEVDELHAFGSVWPSRVTWDVVLGGIVGGRVRIEGAERENLGLTPDHQVATLRTREVRL